MPWGAGQGSRLTGKHVGSRMVVTALLLGEAADTPGSRLDGGVRAEKDGCVSERVKTARAVGLWLGPRGNQSVA